ncbi:MAG: hypothetical protein AVDCRST_MAG19-2830 [uncultured Thermomicrobiales bacterium]|uniref:Uncharacterized protein n=1 Tax=uncultured Thermomicrobiales bacterium TaxID=1645740 RepID=A0A6J4VCC7_9BACT|nr:MAG: hypothetical protein AVDCRST_MAG19-2830 [uncultured Thermomicrobiales bacterium]
MGEDLGPEHDQHRPHEREQPPPTRRPTAPQHVPATGEHAGQAEGNREAVAQKREGGGEVAGAGQAPAPEARRVRALVHVGLGGPGGGVPDANDRAAHEREGDRGEQDRPGPPRQPVRHPLPTSRPRERDGFECVHGRTVLLTAFTVARIADEAEKAPPAGGRTTSAKRPILASFETRFSEWSQSWVSLSAPC